MTPPRNASHAPPPLATLYHSIATAAAPGPHIVSFAAGDGCVISKAMPGKVDVRALMTEKVNNYFHSMFMAERGRFYYVVPVSSLRGVPSCGASYFVLMVRQHGPKPKSAADSE